MTKPNRAACSPVAEPPVTFVDRKEDVVLTGYEAESVTLTGVVSRDTAVVRWLRDWTNVEGERFHPTADGNTRTLTIGPLRRSDAGEYTCDVGSDQIHFSLLVKGRSSYPDQVHSACWSVVRG